jgi:hypothetical protein
MGRSMLQPDQENMPRRQRGHTTTVMIDGERVRLTATERGDGTLGEVLIGWGKHGTSIAGLMDAYGTAISAGLQHGVPIADLLRPGLGLYFGPSGSTDDPEIPRARSAIDYFSRRLAIDWLPDTDRTALGVQTIGGQIARGGGRGPGVGGTTATPTDARKADSGAARGFRRAWPEGDGLVTDAR